MSQKLRAVRAMASLVARHERMRATVCGVIAAALVGVGHSADARITQLQITSRTVAFGGMSFGAVGQYETIVGRATGEVDPSDSLNAIITDIQLAPKNARGMVEYSMDVVITKPVDMSKGNGTILHDVPNRGAIRSPEMNIGGDANNLGDGFLELQGFTLVDNGWEGDINTGLQITLPVARNPDGSDITGRVRSEYILTSPASTQDLTRQPTYQAVSTDNSGATLTRRVHQNDPKETIPNNQWAFADCATTPFPGVPSTAKICLSGGFDTNHIYALLYTAKNPTVMGLGFAATRDLVSFLRYGSAGVTNPLAGGVQNAITYGSSQSGRNVRTFIQLGFNQDEARRIVFEGAIPHKASNRGAFNIRFAQPTRLSGTQHTEAQYPGAESPSTWAPSTDPLSGITAGVLDRCRATNSCPKIIHTNTDTEYSQAMMSLNTTDLFGKKDVVIPPEVRIYELSGTMHGGGDPTQLPGVVPSTPVNCQLPSNPNAFIPAQRALLIALRQWIVNGTEPPPSMISRLSAGSLTGTSQIQYPYVPATSFSLTQVTNVKHVLDRGPLFNVADASGVMSEPPIVRGTYYTLLPQIDADGNPIDGLRDIFVQVPLGTYTGWNVRKAGFSEGDSCDLTGGYIPFFATRAQRLAAGDPRLSLEERYPTHADYVAKVTAAANSLVAQRVLLPQDAALAISQANAAAVPPVGSMAPVPKAACGPSDHTESGLQGQTTSLERSSGDSQRAYDCNLRLVGQFQGEGAFSQDGPSYFGHCAYMATENRAQQAHPGIVVIDVSDPKNPQPTAYLAETNAGLNPHENNKVNAARGLLGLAQSNGPNFAVYDLNADCAHPKLASTFNVPNSMGHMGGWAEDGKTYYIGQQFRGVGGIMPIIDVTDPYNAKWLLNWTFNGDGRPHDLSTNASGTRMYAGQPGNFGAPITDSSFGPDGLVILDMSDVQARRPNPQIRIISRLFWDDQGQVEQMLPFFSKGRSYLISTDESGGQAGVGGLPAACARGASAYGYSNVIDITDEANPFIASKIMLEVHDRKNCTQFINEPPEVGGGILDYSTERCAVDRTTDPTLAACGSRGTGTRVYDIRDPLHPAEIAYWKGPAPRTAFLPGSGSWSPGVDRTVEKQAGFARFVKVPAANGNGFELNLWIVGDANGFQVLRFSDEFLQTSLGKAINAEALQND